MPNEMTVGEVTKNPVKIIPELETAKMLEQLATVLPNGSQLIYAASILRHVASGELAPVVHAHWIDIGYYGQHYKCILECSSCHDEVEELKLRKSMKCCPSCGARMDESVMHQTEGGKDDSR